MNDIRKYITIMESIEEAGITRRGFLGGVGAAAAGVAASNADAEAFSHQYDYNLIDNNMNGYFSVLQSENRDAILNIIWGHKNKNVNGVYFKTERHRSSGDRNSKGRIKLQYGEVENIEMQPTPSAGWYRIYPTSDHSANTMPNFMKKIMTNPGKIIIEYYGNYYTFEIDPDEVSKNHANPKNLLYTIKMFNGIDVINRFEPIDYMHDMKKKYNLKMRMDWPKGFYTSIYYIDEVFDSKQDAENRINELRKNGVPFPVKPEVVLATHTAKANYNNQNTQQNKPQSAKQNAPQTPTTYAIKVLDTKSPQVIRNVSDYLKQNNIPVKAVKDPKTGNTVVWVDKTFNKDDVKNSINTITNTVKKMDLYKDVYQNFIKIESVPYKK